VGVGKALVDAVNGLTAQLASQREAQGAVQGVKWPTGDPSPARPDVAKGGYQKRLSLPLGALADQKKRLRPIDKKQGTPVSPKNPDSDKPQTKPQLTPGALADIIHNLKSTKDREKDQQENEKHHPLMNSEAFEKFKKAMSTRRRALYPLRL
jgi:hypothetical protein